MKSPVVRLAIAAVVIIVISAGAMYSANKGGVHREIRLPEESISTIPKEIGKWTGQDGEVKERLFGIIGAHEVVSRTYTNPASEEGVTLHCAVFDVFWRRVPHSPKVCYPANGWMTIKDDPFELDGPLDPKGKQPTARLVTFEKDDSNIFVLFWFQFGDFVVCDASELASARWYYRNEDTWPPVVKTMIQVSADRSERARKQLKEFANEVFRTTQTFK